MFLILSRSYKGSRVVVNSAEIMTVEEIVNPTPGTDYEPRTFIQLCGGEQVGIEVRESFESIIATLHATMPESVGTVPAIHNVLITACLVGNTQFRVSEFDAAKIHHVTTDPTSDGCLFRYGELMYHSNETFAAIMNKIASVKGK